MSCIKSIQRGTSSGNQTISINEIDASKSIVLITAGTSLDANTEWQSVRGVCTFTLTNTTLVISDSQWYYQFNSATEYRGSTKYTWQVIEFA